jgi:hypothetical protein
MVVYVACLMLFLVHTTMWALWCDIREEGVGSKRSGQVNGIWTWCGGGCDEEVCQGYRSVGNIFMTV